MIDDHPDKVSTYLGGKDGLLGFFIRQVMQRFDGSPNPELVRSLLREKLDAQRDAVNVDE